MIRRIDNFLWQFVTSRWVYLLTIFTIGLFIPMTFAQAVPSSESPWNWIYCAVVVLCVTACFIVARSRERWLEWSRSVSRGRYRRSYPVESRKP